MKNNLPLKKNQCLICFKDFNNEISLSNLFSSQKIICQNCLKKFKILNLTCKFNNVETTFLYEYNDFIRKLIYQYKGCYDIVLKDVFFYQFKEQIKKKYKGYIIVFPPSNESDDQKRGFRHIEKMIECLKMKYLNLFYKKSNYKQSSNTYKQRNKIANVIDIKNIKLDINQKYLIIDDIFTSGATLKTIINLLVKQNIDKGHIKALILSKTVHNVEL